MVRAASARCLIGVGPPRLRPDLGSFAAVARADLGDPPPRVRARGRRRQGEQAGPGQQLHRRMQDEGGRGGDFRRRDRLGDGADKRVVAHRRQRATVPDVTWPRIGERLRWKIAEQRRGILHDRVSLCESAPSASSSELEVKDVYLGRRQRAVAIGDPRQTGPGVAASALRFYEDQGLIRSGCDKVAAGGTFLLLDAAARRLRVRAAQAVGLTLEEIKARSRRTGRGNARPRATIGQRLSSDWRPLIEARIAGLTRLRDALSSCIGCGCLSLDTCALYNPWTMATKVGASGRRPPLPAGRQARRE